MSSVRAAPPSSRLAFPKLGAWQKRFPPAMVVTLAILVFWVRPRCPPRTNRDGSQCLKRPVGPRQPTKRGKHCTMQSDGGRKRELRSSIERETKLLLRGNPPCQSGI